MTLPIDVHIKGVGRIQLRSGTKDKKLKRELANMVRRLPRMGYLDVVRDIASGQRGILEVYGHYQNNTLARLVGPSLDEPLHASLTAWVDALHKAPETLQSYRDAIRYLKIPAKATLRDLPTLLAGFKAGCAERPRLFNMARTMGMAFVRDLMGKHKPLYLDVCDVGSLRERKQGRRGLSLTEAIEVRDKLGPKAARIWWSMVITGMGPKELWGDWEVLSDRILIRGTKRPGRYREVPLIDYPTRPELTRWGFTSALRKLGLAPYQGRKSYAVRLDVAAIPPGRRDMYMGHRAHDMRSLYSQPEITAFLKGDAALLRAQMGPMALELVK